MIARVELSLLSDCCAPKDGQDADGAVPRVQRPAGERVRPKPIDAFEPGLLVLTSTVDVREETRHREL